MKENKYDDISFFSKYSGIDRSVRGLEAAGEWQTLERLLPDFKDKRVLDLGCGFGWHCEYAAKKGAAAVTGIDISEKMLEVANRRKTSDIITYLKEPIEDINFNRDSFDIVISSLALHYINSFEDICKKVFNLLTKGGYFVFSAEHPVFTAQGPQDWHYGANGMPAHWPVDRYFEEGSRDSVFLGEQIIKYHRTLTTYFSVLVSAGFTITDMAEPVPPSNLLREYPQFLNELRRPMMLIISSRKCCKFCS